jgi:hypothetical protein
MGSEMRLPKVTNDLAPGQKAKVFSVRSGKAAGWSHGF